MMNIREYIETIDEEERDEIEATLYACSQEDWDDFEMWAIENGIDLTACDPLTGEYVTVEWGWDMCGD